MSGSSIKRRGFLGTALLPFTIGCLDSVPDLSSSKITLGNIRILNFSQEETEITVRLDGKDGLIFQEEIELEAQEHKVIEKSWSSEPSQYTLYFSGKGQTQQFDLPEHPGIPGSDCIDVDIQPSFEKLIFHLQMRTQNGADASLLNPLQ